jgi:hypothetical protein
MNSEETVFNTTNPDQFCIDGHQCTHNCSGDCFREKFCKPLTNSGLNEDWTPKDIKGINEK